MKSYHFRLARLTRIRELEEKVAKDRLMLALRDLRRAKAMELEAKARLASLEPPTGQVTIAEIQWTQDQAQRLSDSIRICHNNTASAQLKCAETRQAWSEAGKKSSVLARLDARSRNRWREEAMRQELTELDDLASSRPTPAARP
ncbi:hypothetical protein EPN29_13985 [bacterium]|nr:MAG: hypothetical protein EPN29_13985 [bacterium]